MAQEQTGQQRLVTGKLQEKTARLTSRNALLVRRKPLCTIEVGHHTAPGLIGLCMNTALTKVNVTYHRLAFR